MRTGWPWSRLVLGSAVIGACLFLKPPPDAGLRPLDPHYLHLGESLLHGVEQGRRGSFRMPMGTVVPAAVFGHAGLSTAWRQAGAYAELALMLALGAVLGAHPLALAAGVAAYCAFFSPDRLHLVHPEAPYALHLLLVCGLAALWARRPTLLSSVALAAAVGSSLLYRSTLALLPPLLAAAAWRRAKTSGEGGPQAATLLLVPFLFLVPWAAMNWAAAGRPSPFERGAPDLNAATAALGLDDCVELQGPDRQELFERPLERGESIAAWSLAEAAAHPGRYAAGAARRLWRVFTWQPLLLLLAAAAAWRGGPQHRAVGGIAAYYVLAHCAFSIQERYFTPLWPVLIVLAASLAAADRPAQDHLARSALRTALAVSVLAALFSAGMAARYGLLARTRPPSSEAALAAALAAAPDDRHLLTLLGQRELSRGGVAEAASAFERAGGIEPGLSWARALLGEPEPLLARRSSPGARDAFELPVYQAHVALRLGRVEAARAFLRQALEAHNSRLVLYGPRTPEKERLFRRLRTYDNGFVSDAASLIEGRPAAERDAFLAELSRLLPGSSRAWLLRARAEADAGRYPQALAHLARAEVSSPGNEDKLLMRSLAYLRHLGLEPPSPRPRPNEPWILAGALQGGVPGIERVAPR